MVDHNHYVSIGGATKLNQAQHRQVAEYLPVWCSRLLIVQNVHLPVAGQLPHANALQSLYRNTSSSFGKYPRAARKLAARGTSITVASGKQVHVHQSRIGWSGLSSNSQKISREDLARGVHRTARAIAVKTDNTGTNGARLARWRGQHPRRPYPLLKSAWPVLTPTLR